MSPECALVALGAIELEVGAGACGVRPASLSLHHGIALGAPRLDRPMLAARTGEVFEVAALPEVNADQRVGTAPLLLAEYRLRRLINHPTN